MEVFNLRISSKARYGLASMIVLAQNYKSQEYITVVSISERLDISKIYLEQVFSLLKRADLVISTKGAQGGYRLATSPSSITVYDILNAIEISLFEKTDRSVSQAENAIEETMQTMVWGRIDKNISETLKNITLNDLVNDANQRAEDGYMFYI